MCVHGLQAYEDDDRLVRKAGVDVLVKLYERVGELLWTYINDISDAKVDVVSVFYIAVAAPGHGHLVETWTSTRCP